LGLLKIALWSFCGVKADEQRAVLSPQRLERQPSISLFLSPGVDPWLKVILFQSLLSQSIYISRS